MTRETAVNRELMSALVDGELTVGEFSSTVDSLTSSAHGLATWHAYHLVGDALRGSAHGTALESQAFVARLRSRLAAQETGRPLPQPAGSTLASVVENSAREGANDPAIRWKLLAGLASLAAVATFGWHIASVNAGGAVLAQDPAGGQAVAVATAPAGRAPVPALVAAPVMLRDARLDELLAAHKQFGGTSALQMPAGFLRNATFDNSGK